MIERFGIHIAVHHLSELRVELELMAVVHLDVCLALYSTFCLHQYSAINALITKKRGCRGILEDSDTLHFLHTEPVYRTLVAINEDENAFIIERMIATNIK